MKGSILQQLPRYGRFLRGQGGLEIGYPWLTVGAILALEQNVLQPDMRVMEFGSGGSTVFFARRVAHVFSLETNPDWAPQTRAGLKAAGVAEKVRLVCEPLVRHAALVAAEPDNSFDLVLVDHADPTLRAQRIPVDRLPLAEAALPKLRKQGWLVVDNYTIHGMDRFAWRRGWEVWRFDDMRYQGQGTLIARRKP